MLSQVAQNAQTLSRYACGIWAAELGAERRAIAIVTVFAVLACIGTLYLRVFFLLCVLSLPSIGAMFGALFAVVHSNRFWTSYAIAYIIGLVSGIASGIALACIADYLHPDFARHSESMAGVVFPVMCIPVAVLVARLSTSWFLDRRASK